MTTVILIAVLVPSVILHEISHGAVALVFGDDTAKRAGRLTLNPVAHIDPLGTIVLPLILALTGAGMFGWAKPVPVDPGRLRNPRRHGLLVSLAGPATNIVIALAAALLLRPFHRGGTAEVLFFVGVINVVLAAFNLLPIPPLDGSAVVERFLPRRWLPSWFRLRQYSMGLLLVVVLLLPQVLARVFGFAEHLWRHLL